MEYIQTILVQVAASRLEEAAAAGGLLPELEAHRDFLKQQPGFRDLRITRSINREGNVLIVIETRWTDDGSLIQYETHEPNAASIIRRHEDVTVRDSLQVLDMEALHTETSRAAIEAAESARSRVMLPLVIPLGALAFALLAIYGLSRIYLELSKDSATGLAAGITLGILAVALYIANNPRIPGWQIAGIFVTTAAVLAGGAIWALSQGGGTGEATGPTPAASASPAASPGASPAGSPAAGALEASMGDNFFDIQGTKNATLQATAGQTLTINLTNKGTAIHNMRLAGADNNFNTSDDAVSDPNLVPAGQTAKVVWQVPNKPGTYKYQCDFHPADMHGEIVVK